MRISSVNSIQQNNCTFNHRIARPVETKALRPMNMEDKVVLGAKCIGAAGAAGTANIILKENGIDLFKIFKNGIKSIK